MAQEELSRDVWYCVISTRSVHERSPDIRAEVQHDGPGRAPSDPASFSNFGPTLELFAPGQSVTSAWWTSNTAQNTISGTSMAAPHVAGAAALYLQGNPQARPEVVTYAITDHTSNGRLSNIGAGSPNRLLWISAFNGAAPGTRITINLQASNAQYVVAENAGGGAINANRNAAGPWETFTLDDRKGGLLQHGDSVHLYTVLG